MKTWLRTHLKVITAVLLAFIPILGSGCWHKDKPVPRENAFTIRAGGTTNSLMTPATSPVGRIARINKEGNFAVISFPIGQLPANGTVLGVYHAGTKSGQIRISGPAKENLTVGDFIAGSGQEDDEVRVE